MKSIKLLSFLALTIIFSSCASTQKTTIDAIYGNTWQLEFLSGPRIAFNGLYPNKKPQITFNQETKKVEGTTSCNGYNAPYELGDNTISFGEQGPTTMMYCGEGEKFFVNTIKKVNRYKIDADGKLNLMIDEVPMMRFKKTN